MGRLKDRLSRGLAVTVELNPPRGTNLERLLAQAEALKGKVDAIDVTDSHLAKVALSSIAAAYLVQQRVGLEAIFNLTGRDRNLIALQSELLGAAALGLKHVLVLTGDPPEVGDHPQAKGVYDLDSLGLVRLIRKLNEGSDFAGHPLDGPTAFSIGVAVNPGADDLEGEVKKLREKVNAGASFAITQAIYDPEVFLRFRRAVQGLGIPILMGVIPLKSYPFALYLQKNVPGIKIPETSLARMAGATKTGAKSVGLSIVFEVLEEIIPQAEGIHIMPIGDQESLMAILDWIVSRRDL